MQEVMQCLKKYGQRLDLEISAEMRVPLATVRKRLAEVSAAGDVADALRGQQDGRGVAVPGVGVRPGAGPGEDAEGGVAAQNEGRARDRSPRGTATRRGLVPHTSTMENLLK
ncbi:MAG: hypothetical protein H6Q33_5145 [Deltaproteobacteria bacterium]|nr:hypothetical protein [Deltaproteobacteria bacterium]